MDFVENVGRRKRVVGEKDEFINVGIFSLNGYEHNGLFHNLGNGKFMEVGYLAGVDRIEDGRGLGVLDADGDGRLDLLVQNYLQPARLLMNRSPGGGHWLKLKLEGTRSNRSAIGARAVAYHGERREAREVTTTAGYLSGQSLHLHFGLGQDASADRLAIHWPSGLLQEFKDVLYHTALVTPTDDKSDGVRCDAQSNLPGGGGTPAGGTYVPASAVPEDARFPFDGYGEINHASIAAAVKVLAGETKLPARPGDDGQYERARDVKMQTVGDQ